MKSIVDFVLKNKLAVWLLTIILIFTGIYSGMKMKMESLPDISIPYLIVTTVYPGATPEQVDEEVSALLEQQAEEMEHVKNVTTISYQNMSMVTVEYDYGIDMDKAKDNLENAMETITFGENVQEPAIMSISMNAMPVAVMSVSSDELNKETLSKLANDTWLTDLQNIEGVANVSISGQQMEQYVMTFDAKALASYNLTEDTVKQMIGATNMTLPLGLVEFKDSEESVVVDGSLNTVKGIEDIILPAMKKDKTPVIVKDVASITLQTDSASISRTNGNDSLSIAVMKSQAGNTVEVVNAVKDYVKEMKKDAKGLEVQYILDQGEPIEESVHTMLSKALFGALFAVVIILLFLRNFRSTLISVVSIPLSLLIAFFILEQLDITLNIMTLGAVTVAIGRVIDDSIVVVENIFRRLHNRNESLSGRTLVKEATIEMFVPILSSTLVTIAVFLPLGLVGGMVGELFLPFALTMAFSLLASLVVAVTVVPVMAHSLFKKELRGEKAVHHEEKAGKLSHLYEKALNWVLNHKIITSIITLALLVGSLALLPLVGFSFIPSDEVPKQISLSYEPANGETDEDIEQALKEAEGYFLDAKDVTSVQATIEEESLMTVMTGGSGISLTVNFKDSIDNFEDIQEKHLKAVEKLHAKGTWTHSSMSGDMSGFSNTVSYDIYGNSLEEIEPVAKDIQHILVKQTGIENVESTLSDVYVENVLTVNKEKAAQYGLTAGQIGMQLIAFEQTETVTTIQSEGKTFDIVIRKEKTNYTDKEELLQKTIVTPIGQTVKLQDIVDVKEGTTTTSVTRNGGKMLVTVSGTIKGDNVSKITSAIDGKVQDIQLPTGVEVATTGVTADMIEAFTQLGIAMLAAIAIVYFLLVLTFKEGLAPFAILFSLPLTVIGAVIGLLVADETLSISGMLGLLMLIGIVVTNAIVLVDRILHNERDGMDIRSAIIDAGKVRLRPILMTAIATIGALIPLAIGAEGSGLISKGLGVTVIGGLTSSTLLTLLIVPMVYEFLSKLFKKNRKATKDDE